MTKEERYDYIKYRVQNPISATRAIRERAKRLDAEVEKEEGGTEEPVLLGSIDAEVGHSVRRAESVRTEDESDYNVSLISPIMKGISEDAEKGVDIVRKKPLVRKRKA